MKKFFLILLINAPFLLNNTIKADTSQLFTLFDIRKENNVDNVSKLFLDMGFPAKEFYSGYDNTNFFNISFEQEDCHILLNYTPSNRYIFRYQVYKDSLNKNDFLIFSTSLAFNSQRSDAVLIILSISVCCFTAHAVPVQYLYTASVKFFTVVTLPI